MEVHHPPHSTPKKWTHYLWEFFMLFLAVFCGFLAENFREHILDRKKEKEYMISMREDLKEDTARINAALWQNNLLIQGNDSIITCLLGNLQDKKTTEMALVMYLKYGIYYYGVTFVDKTIAQLKNSGGMRLIKKESVLKKLVSYDNEKNYIQADYNLLEKLQLENNTKQANYIFNIKTNQTLYNSVMTGSLLTVTPTSEYQKLLTHQQPVLLTCDLGVIVPFVNNVKYFISLMVDYNTNITAQRNNAVELIELIQKEYKIE
jgi:hypothetical protein